VWTGRKLKLKKERDIRAVGIAVDKINKIGR